MAVLNSVMRAFAVEALPTPADLLAQHPCPANMAQHIDHHRHQVRQILSGADDRLLVALLIKSKVGYSLPNPPGGLS